MKNLNITYEDRIFKQLEKAKVIAEKELGRRISWETFILGAVLNE